MSAALIRSTTFLITILFVGTGVFAQSVPQQTSFSAIAKRVEPAVVSIDAKAAVARPSGRANPSATPQGEENELLDMLRRQIQQRPVYAVGSGFLVDRRGYILTNNHVIEDSSRIIVKLDSGEEYVATVVGTDEETDLAVLKIDAGRDLPYLRLGDSDNISVGDWVLAIGSPFGLAKSVTAGIISQTRRETPTSSAFQKFIQTDAAINRGNSGGPLVDLNGNVIGVNSQIATSTGDYNGVGFALPSNEASYVFDQIVKHGRVRRGYLGAYLDSVRAEFAAVYGLGDGRGAIVTEVRDRKGPAALAGLQAGDVVIEFKGQPVESAQDLIAKVASSSPDETVTFKYIRDNGTTLTTQNASAVLIERPTSERATPSDDRRLITAAQKPESKPFGLTVVQLTPQNSATFRFDGLKGVVVREIDQSNFIADVRNANGFPALAVGDLIQRVNRVAVTDVPSFQQAVSRLKPGDPVVLHVSFYNPAQRAVQLKVIQFTNR